MNRTKMIFVVGTAAALVAACSSSKTTSASSTSAPSSTSPAAGVTSAPISSVAPATSPRRSSPPVAGPELSGSWKGTYSGTYTGTFVLQWAQSKSKLTGTINLSTAPGAMTINGTVAGSRIRFGTVGSQAITYSGSVSGRSMSGHYEVAGGAGGSGSWSATRGS